MDMEHLEKLRRQPRRPMVLVLAVLLGMLGVAWTVASAPPAHALCAAPAMEGDWHNIDVNTRSMTRVVVGFNCGDQVLCDTDGHCTGGESYFTFRPFGKCSPTDCDWGTRLAQAMSDGWHRAI